MIKAILSILLVSSFGFTYGQTYLTASVTTPGNAGVLAENCEAPYSLVIRRGPDNLALTTIFISDNGTTTIGTDYTFPDGAFPAELEAGDSVIIIPIIVNNDGLPEGTETIDWEIAFIAGNDDGAIYLETAILDELEVEIETPNDTIQWCRDVPYVLLANSLSPIHWSPAEFFDDAEGPAATVRPFESGWYYAEVGNDTCGAKDSVYFELAIVDIDKDTVFICIGESVTIQGSLQGLATEFIWSPTDSLQTPDILNPIANPTVSTIYTLQSDIGVCTASDRILVQVDSLPADMHIDIAPPKPYYCAGEIVAIYSPSFDSLLYPDITFEWTPNNGTFLSDLDLLNAALQLQDTTTYIRENINNACSTFDSIVINVVPPSVPLSVTDTILCPGEMFTVEVLADNITSPEWTPATGLSCTECTITNVTVIGEPGSSLFYQFSGMILDCPVGANLSIEIPQPQQIIIGGDSTICEGQTTELTITNPEGLTNFEWSITSGIGDLSCNDCTSPSFTVQTFDGNDEVILVVTAENTSGQKCGAFGFVRLHRGIQLLEEYTLNVCKGVPTVAFPLSPDYTNVAWNISEGDISLSCSNCPATEVTANSNGKIRYTAELPGTDTCEVIGVVEIRITPPVTLEYNINPGLPIAQGSEVTIEITNVPPPSSVQWTVNGAILPTTSPTVVFNANEELNTIVAEYINSNGCTQIDTISFPSVPPNFMIPNAFTPDNGDDINDHFRVIINGDLQLEEFLVFNRWGQLVYEAPSGDLVGWDGMWKEKPAPSDTYVYTAKLKYPDGRTEIAKGDVALLR